MIGTAANNEPDPQSAAAETTVAVDPQAAPSVRVATVIADATGEDPTTMSPLYHAVDTDALDSLLQADTEFVLAFDYEGHEVEVRSNGHVGIDGAEYEVQ